MMLDGDTLLRHYCSVQIKVIKSSKRLPTEDSVSLRDIYKAGVSVWSPWSTHCPVYWLLYPLNRSIRCLVLYPSSNPQRQEGHMQRFIREVNTTSRSCVLWDLEEETDYIIQVQSIGLYGESQASKKVHFRTLKKSDRFPSNSSNQGKLWDTGTDNY